MLEQNTLSEADRETLQSFVNRFIRLHGIIFTRLSTETFAEIETTMLRMLDLVLCNKLLSEMQLLMIFTINIFSIHSTRSNSSKGEGNNTEQNIKYEELHKLAIRFNVRFLTIIMKGWKADYAHWTLGPISVFFDYLASKMNELHTLLPEDQSVWQLFCNALAQFVNVLDVPLTQGRKFDFS